MPTPTYTPLATVTLGSSASSVTFSSIPATYRDLVLVLNGSASASAGLSLRLNSDTGNNYPYVFMQGRAVNGATSEAGTGDAAFLTASSVVLNTQFQLNTNVMDYSATDKHKTILSRANTTDAGSAGGPLLVNAAALRWANTAAVNTLLVRVSTGNFNSGSRFDLYGIAS